MRQPTCVNVIGQHSGPGRDHKLPERGPNFPTRDPKLTGKESNLTERIQRDLDSFQ